MTDKFTKEELGNEKNYQRLSKELDSLLLSDLAGISGGKASELISLKIRLEKSLEELGATLSPETLKKYQDYLLKLKFYLLHLLSDEEEIKLFREHFLFGWKMGIDIQSRLKIRLMTIPTYRDRDPHLTSLKEALRQNKELLGLAPIYLGEKEKVKPHLSNWLRDYEFILGTGKHGYLEMENYFLRSFNVRTLSKDERALLRSILEFYELLKLEIRDPGALSTYSEGFFGIKSIGVGLKRRFLPVRPDTAAFYKEEQKKAVERLKLARKAAPKLKEKPKVTAPLPKEEVTFPKSKKLEAGLGGPAIPKTAILKLNTIDGLSQLSVEDFRLFSPRAREAARFVFNKIRKLVMDQPAMRPQIRASFQNSPLYKLYLSCAKEALDTKRDVGQVAQARKAEGRIYLTEEEYKAVGAIAKAI